MGNSLSTADKNEDLKKPKKKSTKQVHFHPDLEAHFALVDSVNHIILNLLNEVDQLPFISSSFHDFLKPRVYKFFRSKPNGNNSLIVESTNEAQILANNLKQFIENLSDGQLLAPIYHQVPVTLSGAAFDFYIAFALTAARIIKDDHNHFSLSLDSLPNFIRERELNRVQYVIADYAKYHHVATWFKSYSLLSFKGAKVFINNDFEAIEYFIDKFFNQYHTNNSEEKSYDQNKAKCAFISMINYSLQSIQISSYCSGSVELVEKIKDCLSNILGLEQVNMIVMLDQLAYFSAYVQTIAILAKYWSISNFFRYMLALRQARTNIISDYFSPIVDAVNTIFALRENLTIQLKAIISHIITDVDENLVTIYSVKSALCNLGYFCLGWFSNPDFLAQPTDLIYFIACYIDSLHLLIKQQVGNNRVYTDCLSCYKQYCLALQQLINYQLFDFSLFLSYENQLFEQLTLDNKQANTDQLTQGITRQTNYQINDLINELNRYIPDFDNELAKFTQAIFWSSFCEQHEQVLHFSQCYNDFIASPYEESIRSALLRSIEAINAMNEKRVLQVTVPAFTLSTMLLIAGIVILGLVSTGLLCSGYGTALGAVGLCVTGSLAVSAGLVGVGYASYFNWGVKRKFGHLIASVFKLVSNINDQIEISQFKTALIQTKIKHIHQEAMGSPLSMHLSTYQQPKSYASQFATGTANFFSHYVCQPSRRVLASMCCQV